MVFEEITLKNYATYKNVNTINLLPDSSERPVILIGGENGCGKTTLLDAFQLVLFGAAAQCSNRGKLTYETYLERCINRDTPQEDGSSIKLTFHFYSGGDKKHFKIERAWAKKGKKIQEQFWVYQLTDGEIRFEKSLSQNWADYVEGFIPAQVAPFFFFDGEKIEKLADFENSGQLVHAAIHSLLGLNTVDQLEVDLIALEKKKQKELATQEDLNQLEKIESELSDINAQIKTMSDQASLLTVQSEIAQKQLKEVEIRFRQQGGDLYEKRTALEEQFSSGKKIVVEQEDNLREIATGTAPLLLVKNLLNRIKIQAETEEIAHREEIVCEMLDTRDQNLLAKLAAVNGDIQTVSAIKTYLDEDRNQRRVSSLTERYLNLQPENLKTLNSLIETELPSLEETLPLDLAKLQGARTDLEVIQRSLDGVPDESKIAAILEERKTAQQHLEETQVKLDFVMEERDRIKRQQDLKQSGLKRELERTAALNFEGKDIRRMLQYSATVRNTLNVFRAKIIEKHMTNIELLVMNSFRSLLRKESLVKRIEIGRTTCQVMLFNKNDHQVLPERLSAGERQLLATALLWGICQAAGKPLPTIIDTPLGRLDTSHRTNLVRNYFPKASHQVLLLSTNEEIVGKYYDGLKPFISRTCLLSHSELTGGTTIHEGYFS